MTIDLSLSALLPYGPEFTSRVAAAGEKHYGFIRIEIQALALIERTSFPSPESRLRLGDIIASVTKSIGISPCPACLERQHILNQAIDASPLETLRRLARTL